MPGLHQVAANAFGDPSSGILDGIACAGTSGIVAHTGLAVTLAGCPLGLFGLNAAFRDVKTVDGVEPGLEVNEKESTCWLRGLDWAAALSAACPGMQVVNFCDREGDF